LVLVITTSFASPAGCCSFNCVCFPVTLRVGGCRDLPLLFEAITYLAVTLLRSTGFSCLRQSLQGVNSDSIIQSNSTLPIPAFGWRSRSGGIHTLSKVYSQLPYYQNTFHIPVIPPWNAFKPAPLVQPVLLMVETQKLSNGLSVEIVGIYGNSTHIPQEFVIYSVSCTSCRES
jgi:hypothetical protein